MSDIESAELAVKTLHFAKALREPACLKPARVALKQAKLCQIQDQSDPDQIRFELASGRRCLVVWSVSDKSELASVANTLLAVKKEIKDRQVIALVFLDVALAKAEDLLMRAGCAEVLSYDLSPKAFAHKLTRSLRSLERLATSSNPTAHFRPAPPETWNVLSSGYQVKFTEAKEHPFDYWLFRRREHAKRYKEFWFIEMIGPSPAAGRWDSLSPNQWIWTSKPNFEKFSTADQSWIFSGQKPEYSWINNRWAFVSTKPKLHCEKQGFETSRRFDLTGSETLSIAKNSQTAQDFFGLIKTSFASEYQVFSDGPELPWSDFIDSRELGADWQLHDSSEAPSSGAQAMQACGLSGRVKQITINILEYSSEYNRITLGTEVGNLQMKESIEVEVQSENLGLGTTLKLRGVVEGLSAQDESGLMVASVNLTEDSRSVLSSIRDAVELRQANINRFLKKSKGID